MRSIVINKIMNLKTKHLNLLEEHIVEILSIVQESSTHDIRRKALELATDLLSSRSKDDVIAFLKSEIKNEAAQDITDRESLTKEYREFIIQRIAFITQ